MEWLAEIASGVATGGVTSVLGAGLGMLGGWLAKKEARKMKEMELSHEKEMASLDLETLRLEQDHALQVAEKKIDLAETEGKIAIEEGELSAFKETIKQQGQMTGHIFFDGLKSAIRPLLTIILLIQLAYLQYQIGGLIGGLESLPQEQLIVLYLRIIEAIIFLATTALGWWFGSRRGQV
jgi:hypothetical protein